MMIFSRLYFGDAQNDIRTHWSRIAREALRPAATVIAAAAAGLYFLLWGISG